MRRLLLAWLMFASGGCSDTGDLLLVELKTDYVAGIEVATVRTVVRDEAGAEQVTREAPVSLVSDLAAGLRVADVAGLPAGQYEVEVTLVDVEGVTTAARAVRIDVAGNTGVTVVITRSCEGVVCPGAGAPAATACLGGRCVPPECTPETPESCPASTCPETPCPAGAACADALCQEGECFLVARPGTCAGGQWCEPQSGCMTLPSGVDAGTDADVGVDAMPPGDVGTDGSADSGADIGSDGGVDAGPRSPSVECSGGAVVFPTTMDLVEPSMRVDGLTLFARLAGNSFLSTRSSSTATDFSAWTLGTERWARSDAAFVDEGGGEVSVFAAGRGPRHLEWCQAPLDTAPCDPMMIFETVGTLIDADSDGPTLGVIDGRLVMVFSQGRSLYFARPLTGDRLTWEARPIALGGLLADDPALTPDGSLLVIPDESNDDLYVMDYDPRVDDYVNLRLVIGAQGGSPQIGTATAGGFELFVTRAPGGTSQPYRWQCVLR